MAEFIFYSQEPFRGFCFIKLQILIIILYGFSHLSTWLPTLTPSLMQSFLFFSYEIHCFSFRICFTTLNLPKKRNGKKNHKSFNKQNYGENHTK